MMRFVALALLLPVSAWAQLVLSAIDGTTETTLAANSLYQMRSMEVGDTQSVRLRVRNSGTQPAEITRFFADGVGFSLNRPLPPQTLAAGGFLNATLTFDAAFAANYTANLQLNNASVTVLVSVSPGPLLTIPASCMSTAVNTVDFGTVTRGQLRACELTLANPTAQSMTVSTLAVTGTGFTLSRAAPLTLGIGQSVGFAVQVTAQTTGILTGSLKIQGRNYALRAVAINVPLPAPIFEFESSAAGSGQQRRLTMRLPSPSPVTTSGQVNLAFTADSVLAADDPAVMFVETATRQVRFAVEEGKTAVTLNSGAFATFQTGTTAGRIRFTLSGIAPGPAAEAETTVILSPSQIVLEKALPARFADRVELVLIGFDNTFSAGSMNFRFFDNGGQAITALLPVDFTGAFRTFYTSTPGGSTFKLTVRFPVSGNSFGIASVEAEASNSAGIVRTGRLNF
jgi:hypothetical protein